ncbi:outer membrane protein assembly factor BamA [Siphonobacter sp.]|uniref:outer membrane protein assembly factor BamA n=1 Tax=Siphonobacter sp. TaxID=1869184 RepID=UPI003B3BCCDD
MRKVFPLLLIFLPFLSFSQARVGLGGQPATPQQPAASQEIDYTQPKEYIIKGITTSGTKFYDANSLISISGLGVGDKIQIPGIAISGAIKKLMDQGILEDVEVTATKIEGENIWLDIFMRERSRLYKITFTGVRKGEKDALNDKVKLIKGKIINEALIKNTQATIKKHYVEKGFLNADVKVRQVSDTARGNNAALNVTITKGPKIKIHDLDLDGREQLPEATVRNKMKGTKQMRFGRVFTPSKFIPKKFEEDKGKVIDFYNKKGYRDARIVVDSVYSHDNKTVDVYVKLEEGKKYYFRNISWQGNYLHSDSLLTEILGLKKGDVYNPEELQKRLQGSPGYDVSSLYMDAGYLYFRADPEETAIEGDSIDINFNIFEGKQFTINKIILNGNTKTSDHVVLREILTLPGQKFSKTAVVSTQQELARLGYFDAEKIGINPIPRNDYTVDIEYTVEEKASDQIELSGGWGGYIGFVGTLGVVFNNFSARNITNLKAWRPLPAGDGQKLAVRFQANGKQFQNYSLSFTEPWLGGKKPNAFSFNINRQVYRIFDYNGYGGYGSGYGYGGYGGGYGGGGYGGVGGPLGNERGYFNTTGASISLGKRLRRPDNRFGLNMALSYMRYEFKNYGILQIRDFDTGNSNNISLITTLTRYDLDNPQYTRRGSSLSLSATLTPPYSLFRPSNWNPNEPQEKYRFLEYHKWMFDLSWFVPITGKLVFHTRAHMGFLGNYNSKLGIIPLERFVLGGSGLSGQGQFAIAQDIIGLRGYDDRSVRTDPTRLYQGNGGVVYNKYVMEIRYPISLNPSATVFVLGFMEAGNNWDSYKYFNPFDLKRSAGIGARIFMPAFGMIGIDYGYGFDRNVGPTGSIQQAGKGQFHFTIGQQIR